MLKNISPANVKRLCELQGESHERVKIKDLLIGIMIRVDTRTGNIYFFEAEIPKRQLMGVVRCQSRPLTLFAGFLGVKPVNYLFQIGGIIYHGNDATSQVTRITLLNSQNIEN